MPNFLHVQLAVMLLCHIVQLAGTSVLCSQSSCDVFWLAYTVWLLLIVYGAGA